MTGYFLAHFLLWFTFEDKSIFWYIFSAAMLVLISYSIAKEEIENNLSLWKCIIIGALSGTFLFGLFWFGNLLITFFDLPLYSKVSSLYKWYAPERTWHFVSLMLIIAPGEEIFWRGFIQKRLMNHVGRWTSIPVSAILYASVHLYATNWMLAFSALFAGVLWGWLYAWKKSMPLVIVSHLIFDLFLFVIVPFR
jgi:uncharacterized protein